MNIGIIGAGHIGATLARLFVDAGHEAAVSNSRGPATLGAVVAELGPRAHAMTAAEAARFGEVVVVSVPFGRYRELPTEYPARRARPPACDSIQLGGLIRQQVRLRRHLHAPLGNASKDGAPRRTGRG